MLVLKKASVLCYRLFDVAEEINLEVAQKVLAADTRRLKLQREGSEFVVLPNPPLVVELSRRQLALKTGALTVDVTGRLFDHGALSICLHVPVESGTTLSTMVPMADELFDSAAVEHIASEAMNQLRAAIAPAVEHPHLWEQTESYTVIVAREIEGNPKAKAVLADPDLPRLLLGETGVRGLSEGERADITEQHFSYTEDDLAVIHWNAAFVYEPSTDEDIPLLLEIANTELLELRYYDDVLDAELRRSYEQAARPRRWHHLFRSPYANLSRRLLVTLLELSEFIERVENGIKIIGDTYLARVYEGALHQLRIGPWQASVNRKMGLLGRTYERLKGEVDTGRSLTLEATIVLLIVVELFVALTGFLR